LPFKYVKKRRSLQSGVFVVNFTMKNLIILALISLCACSNPNEEAKTSLQKEMKTIMVGADNDSNGCKSSAGYQWSTLKKECIRSFELALQLSAQNNSTNAGLLFNNDSSKIEFFCAEGKGILNKNRENWSNQDWKLVFQIPNWTLVNLHNKTIIYSTKNKS
jgi:hypothetical protein